MPVLSGTRYSLRRPYALERCQNSTQLCSTSSSPVCVPRMLRSRPSVRHTCPLRTSSTTACIPVRPRPSNSTVTLRRHLGRSSNSWTHLQIRAGSSARDEPLSESEKERLEDFQCELLEVGTKARNKVLRLNRLESKVSELGVTAERAVKR